MNRRQLLQGLLASVPLLATKKYFFLNGLFRPSEDTTLLIAEGESLSDLATVYYSREALKDLTHQFRFLELVMFSEIPSRNSKTIQFFRYV